MSSATRTFIALTLPEPARRAMTRLQEELSPKLPSFRWTRTDQLHLTLAFLGDVPSERLAALGEAVDAAVTPFGPLSLAITGLGAFPTPTRPSVVWVGLVGDDLDALRRLREAVALAARSAGTPPADDRFTPHVTIGRLRPGRGRPPDLRPLLNALADWSAGLHGLDHVAAYASSLTPQGPQYTALATFLLEGRKSAPSP